MDDTKKLDGNPFSGNSMASALPDYVQDVLKRTKFPKFESFIPKYKSLKWSGFGMATRAMHYGTYWEHPVIIIDIPVNDSGSIGTSFL
jgi:hypothetical protein